MNRRNFIKRSALLLGLFITEPRQALSCISYLHKSPLSWRDKILQLYPDPDRSPLMQMIDTSAGTTTITLPGPIYKWWEIELEPWKDKK